MTWGPLGRAWDSRHLQEHTESAREVPVLVADLNEIEHLLQGPTSDELHREVDASLRVHSELVNRHDTGVVELIRDLRLFEKSAQHCRVDHSLLPGIRCPPAEDYLHRQIATKVLVEHLEHGAHSPATDFAPQQVARIRLGLRDALEATRGRLSVVLQLHAGIDALTKVQVESALDLRDLRLLQVMGSAGLG